jgi:hypothetical protein
MPRAARPIPAAEVLADSIRRAVEILNEAGRAVIPPTLHRVPLTRRASATQLFALTAVERPAVSGAEPAPLVCLKASIHPAVRGRYWSSVSRPRCAPDTFAAQTAQFTHAVAPD